MTNNAHTPSKKIKSKKSLTWFSSFLIIVGIISSVSVCIFTKQAVVNSDATPAGFSMQGVAINQPSSYVDYSNLANNGINFAYIAATTGDSFTEDNYQTSYKRAEAASLKVGTLQTYDSTTDASTQAQYLINHVGNQVGQLPIAISVASRQVSTRSDKERLAELITILNDHYNKSAIIYTTPDVQKRLSTVISKTKYWLVEDNLKNTAKENQFIQYSEDHTIGTGLKAIKMPTSVFNGTRKQFEDIK